MRLFSRFPFSRCNNHDASATKTAESSQQMEQTCGTVETISRLARWRVAKLDTMGPWLTSGQFLHCWSDPFKIGIWEWVLDICKKPDNQKVFIGVIVKESPAAKEQPPIAKYKLRVFDTEAAHFPYISRVFETDFRELLQHWHIYYTPDGPFIIDVEFLDLKISPASGGEESTLILPSEGIMQSLGTKTTLPCLSRMLKEDIHMDVTINMLGGVLKAHKAVLSASSPVFKSMFLHDLKEKVTSTLNIEDMTIETCTTLISCMYGAINKEEFLKQRLLLLQPADKYCMADLKNCIEESLLEDISSCNVLERLQKAHIYQLNTLKKLCFKYLFDFGIINDVRNEINSFFDHADRDLMLEIFRWMIATHKPVYN